MALSNSQATQSAAIQSFQIRCDLLHGGSYRLRRLVLRICAQGRQASGEELVHQGTHFQSRGHPKRITVLGIAE